MSKQTKEELIRALEGLEIQLDRVIKIPDITGEPEDRESIDILINQIIALTNELMKI